MAASITSGRRHQSGYAALHYIRLIFPAGQSSPNISTWLLQSIASHCLLRLVIYPLHELSQKIIRVLTASITIKWNDILNVWSRRWLVNNRSGLFKQSAPPLLRSQIRQDLPELHWVSWRSSSISKFQIQSICFGDIERDIDLNAPLLNKSIYSMSTKNIIILFFSR